MVHPERHSFIKDLVKEQEHEALRQLFLGPWPHLGACLSSQPCIRSLGTAEVKTVLNENEHIQVVAAIYCPGHLMQLKWQIMIPLR